MTQAGADLEDVGEFGVAEGDVGGAGGEGMNAVPQGTQALVDELRLPEALPLGLRLAHPLTARQVHKPQLGPPHIPCPHSHSIDRGLLVGLGGRGQGKGGGGEDERVGGGLGQGRGGKGAEVGAGGRGIRGWDGRERRGGKA